MFKNKTVRNRVMAHINQMIDDAESQIVLGTKLLEDKLKEDKEALIETHVNKILGKII